MWYKSGGGRIIRDRAKNRQSLSFEAVPLPPYGRWGAGVVPQYSLGLGLPTRHFWTKSPYGNIFKNRSENRSPDVPRVFIPK